MPTRVDTQPRSARRRAAFDSTWITIGWQGVTVRVPEEWSPVAVSSEGEGGYMRIASPDTRSVEIKWQMAKQAPSLPQALERYFKQLRRTAKRARHELVIKERPKSLRGIRPQEQAPIGYSWEADRKALGVIWHCGECRRLVIAELIGQPEDDLSLAPRVLASIAEHGREGWNTWGMYGLAVDVPAVFRLERHQLMSGYLKFAFRHKASTLQVERWGLANVALKGAQLEEWFLKRERDRLSRYRFKRESVEEHGHPVLRLAGAERLLPGAMRSLHMFSQLRIPALFFRGYVWHCPESNRIFAVTGQERRRGDVVRQVFERFACHQEEGEA